MKKTVLLRAPLLTQSGYGVHALQIARYLLGKSDIDVKFQSTVWGNTPWTPDRDKFDGLIGQIIDRSVDFSQRGFDAALSLCLPNEWDQALAKINVGMTAGVETDRCNPEWTNACNKMDMIVVPSEHAKLSLGNVSKPIVVVPESYPDVFRNAQENSDIEFSTKFNFLIFGQITGDNPFNDRKNTFFTLKWLFEEFKNEPNVGVILKTNLGRNTFIDRNHVEDLVAKLVREVRPTPFPKVHVLHGNMNDIEIASLYKNKSVKALVSATRGEGFGLPLLEASASGLPIIATPWSGHMDFLKKGRFIELFYQLDYVHQSRIDNKIFMSGTRWAEVNEHDFKKKVRKFYNSNDIPKQWASSLEQVIKNEYSFEAISKKYDDVLGAVL